MNLESIELRIDELNIRKKVLIKKALDLRKQIREVDGRIAEMWEWHDGWKEKGDYGHRKLEGGVRVMQVPKFKTQEEMQRALSGKAEALGELDEMVIRDIREHRASPDAQQAVNILSGQSPFDDDADTR